MTGDLNDFCIEKATREDIPDILQFLISDFLHAEPLNVALDIKPEDASAFFEEIINASLATPLSYIIYNSSREIIAVRLSSIIHRPGSTEMENFSFDSRDETTCRMEPIQKLLHNLEDKIWTLLPEDVHTLINWLILSVRKDYTGRGIARHLIEYNWDEIRTFGCQGFVAEATAFKSQQLFERCGYQRIYAVELDKWMTDDGRILFKCKDETTRATLEYLPFPKP